MREFAHATALIQEGIRAGLHPGAQLCVWRGGECLIDAAFGRTAFDGGAGPSQ